MSKAILVTDTAHSDKPLLATSDPEVLGVMFDALKRLLDRWEQEAWAELQASQLRGLLRSLEEGTEDDARE